MANEAVTEGAEGFARARRATGPKGHPLWGVLPQTREDVLGFLMDAFRTHGDVVRYRLGPIRSHLIAHPDGIKRVLQDNVANYTKDHFSYSLARRVVGEGLVTSQGSFWLRQRRLAQPAFHRQRIAAMAQQMAAAATETADAWSAHPSETPVHVGREMMALTLQVVGDALFGTKVGPRAELVGRAFTQVNEQIVWRFRSFRVLPPILPFGKDRAFRFAVRQLRGVVDEIIAERRQGGTDRGDLLSMFMLARDEDTGEQMTDAQLSDEVLTMLIAGHETTSTTLTWVFSVLASHPEVEAKLHRELDEVLAGRAPTVQDVPKLEYTRMVIDETLRLYPPLYIVGRKVVADDVLCGHRIPAGTSVDISPYVTHRHPAFWERPDDFVPERFTKEQAASRPRYAYLPFSGGPRQCIGNTFAIMEAQLILATLAQRFRLRPGPGYSTVPDALVTLRPRGDLPMLIEKRTRAPSRVAGPTPPGAGTGSAAGATSRAAVRS